MNRRMRDWRIWAMTFGVIAITMLVLWLTVFAEQNAVTFIVQPYSNVVRFEAGNPVATLQVQIYDLSGKKIWDSGVVSSEIVDWDRTNKWGEQLAYGPYIYVAQGWSADGGLVLHKRGKLVLLPGDEVRLQATPLVSNTSLTLNPMAVDVNHSNETWSFGKVLVNTTNDIGSARLKVNADVSSAWDEQFLVEDGTTGGYFKVSEWMSGSGYLPNFTFRAAGINGFAGGFVGELSNEQDVLNANAAAVVVQAQKEVSGTYQKVSNANLFMVRNYATPHFTIDASGKVGIGTTTPIATLEVHGSATNLLALYDPATPTDPKFRVEKTGTVLADGAYYGTGYYTGSADVAERINVSEWVEAGDVVEIDPNHPGFFRKSRSPYSTRAAGIISTSPGVVLGNSFDASSDRWQDTRPVLAITGRVPVKATTENGPIKIGDLLVSSSLPGYAMRCSDPQKAVGAVIGKAMEALEEGTGIIMVQVILR